MMKRSIVALVAAALLGACSSRSHESTQQTVGIGSAAGCGTNAYGLLRALMAPAAARPEQRCRHQRDDASFHHMNCLAHWRVTKPIVPLATMSFKSKSDIPARTKV